MLKIIRQKDQQIPDSCFILFAVEASSIKMAAGLAILGKLWVIVPSTKANLCLKFYDIYPQDFEKSWQSTHTHPFNGPWSGITRVGRYQKGKTKLDFTEAETVSGSGISCVICKAEARSGQTTTPAFHHSVFTGLVPFLLPSRLCQSTADRQKQ